MISVVITTHGEGRDLPGILSSLHCQRVYKEGISTKGDPYKYEAGPIIETPDIEIIVSCDGYLSSIDKTRVDPDTDVSCWIENDKAEPSCCGHNTREQGIMAACGDWVVLTNSDNVFFAGWLYALTSTLFAPSIGMAYWNIVSNLWGWQARRTRISWGDVDLSCVCVRRDIAQDVGFEWRHYDADWDYVKACSEMCDLMRLRKIHIDEVLGVHN